MKPFHASFLYDIIISFTLLTSSALQDAGGLGNSNPNIPTLKARCQQSYSSSNTPQRNAAFDRVLLASNVMLVRAFFFLPE